MPIYKLFFNYKVLKCDGANGIKIYLLSLFCITLTIFGFKGESYALKKGLFNLDIALQITPKFFKNKFFPDPEDIKKNWVSLCRNCGPMVKYFTEYWGVGHSEPYMIEFIEYDDSAKPRCIDKIKLKDKPKGKSVKYLACMNCNDMVVKMPPDQAQQMVEQREIKKI